MRQQQQQPGADYVAVSRISDRENKTLAGPGERCDKVPAEALEHLAADGDIRLEREAEKPTRGRKAKAAESDDVEEEG